MNTQRATLEVIAPTVEEAIEKGLADLNLPRSMVRIEVLDEGSRGLFGLGGRQARIRLSILKDADDLVTPSTPVEPAAKRGAQLDFEEEDFGFEDEEEAEIAMQETGDERRLVVARETVQELLGKMHIRASVSAQYGKPDERNRRPPIHVDIKGNDLSILIGRRSETLNALQYIARLIISKELGSSITLVIDVEGYRARREKQLRQLARRMADQAINTRRRQILEPMPANERRIIHIELRNHPLVTTESQGEEPHRKITIVPK